MSPQVSELEKGAAAGCSPRRILLCAFACRPYAGSEPMVGWSAYQALRTRHQVKVICSASGARAIEKAVQEGQASADDFLMVPERWRNVGRPAVDKLTVWLNTFDFQRNLARNARALIRDFRPEVIHQVTIATWRAGNSLRGCGIPLVWGPLGGGESIPLSFLGTFSSYSKGFELLRILSGFFSRHNREVVQTARQAGWVFAGNQPTASLLRRLRGRDEGLEVLPVVAFARDRLREFLPRAGERRPGPLRMFSGGYVEARKGMGLALRALGNLKKQGYRFDYEHAGIGPEQAHLTNQIRREGLSDCVRFVDSYTGPAYGQKLRETDIYLFPSLRENCGISLLEAMGHGCVPVVADHAGPGEIVSPECGVKIPVTRPAEFIDRLTEELAKLFRDEERRRRLGEAARLRVMENFSREHWLSRVENAYELARGRHIG